MDSEWNGRMLSIVPAFVMSVPLDKIKPYARLGLKLGVMNSLVFKDHDVLTFEGNPANDIKSTSKDYGGIAIGAQASVGTDFALSDRFSLFGEIQLDGISYSPKHGKYTEYIKNGIDQLESMTVRQKEWNYVEEATISTNNIPADEPDQKVTRNFMFGNVGLVLGVKINL